MPYQENPNSKELLRSDFSVTTERVTSPNATFDMYKLEDWYQVYSSSTVPLQVLTSEDAANLVSPCGLKIGGDNITSTNTQVSNRALFISKKFYKYDPSKLYRMTIRCSSSSDDMVFAGFVGLNNKPTIVDQFASDSPYLNEIHNLKYFAIDKDGGIHDGLGSNVTPTFNDIGANLMNFYSFCINKNVSGSALDENSNTTYEPFTEFTGWVTGFNEGWYYELNQNIGTHPEVETIDLVEYGPFNMNDKTLYFAPCFMVNIASAEPSNTLNTTIVDYVAVNEYIINIKDKVVNIGDGAYPTSFERQNYAAQYFEGDPEYDGDSEYSDSGYFSFESTYVTPGYVGHGYIQ
jgi:hypothetical protein